MKLKRKYKYKKFIILLLSIITIILIYTIYTINYVGNVITPKINKFVIKITDDNVNHYIASAIDKNTMSKLEIDDIIHLNMYKDNIVSVDYNLKNVYNYLGDTINTLYSEVYNLDINNPYYDNDKKVFKVPMGFISNNVLISHLGPKIPIKIDLLREINISFKTKLSDYGINNSLVELYLNITVYNNIINPFYQEEYSRDYEILIGSRMVVGKIPDYYNGLIEKSSSIVSS